MPRRNIYKVTIESGVNDPSKRQNRTFYIDEEDDELLWHLLNRIGTTRDRWEEQQQRRRADEARREREQFEREQQANRDRDARARQAREDFYAGQHSRAGGPSYTFTAGFFDQGAFNFEEFANAFRGSDDGFRSGSPRTEHKTSPSVKSKKEQLADMAQLEWETARTMDLKKLLRRAQRVCHPDHGGSHEKWLDLQKLQQSMGL